MTWLRFVVTFVKRTLISLLLIMLGSAITVVAAVLSRKDFKDRNLELRKLPPRLTHPSFQGRKSSDGTIIGVDFVARKKI